MIVVIDNANGMRDNKNIANDIGGFYDNAHIMGSDYHSQCF